MFGYARKNNKLTQPAIAAWSPVTAIDLLTEPRLMPLHLQPAVDHQKPVHLPLGWQGVCLAPEARPVIEKLKQGWPTEAKHALRYSIQPSKENKIDLQASLHMSC